MDEIQGLLESIYKVLNDLYTFGKLKISLEDIPKIHNMRYKQLPEAITEKKIDVLKNIHNTWYTMIVQTQQTQGGMSIETFAKFMSISEMVKNEIKKMDKE